MQPAGSFFNIDIAAEVANVLLVSGLTLANVAQTTTTTKKKNYMYVHASPLGLAHLVPVHFAATGNVRSSCPESLSSSQHPNIHGEPEPSPDR